MSQANQVQEVDPRDPRMVDPSDDGPAPPLKRKPRTFHFDVARSAAGENVLNTIDISRHYELST